MVLQKTAYAQGSALQAEINYKADEKNKPQSLTWISKSPLEIKIRSTKENPAQLYVVIKGNYAKEDYSVLIDGKQHEQDYKKNFEAEVPIVAESQWVTFDAIGFRGDIERIQIEIKVPEYAKIKSELIEEGNSKKFSSSFGVGPTLLNYSQTGAVDYNEWLMTVRASGTYKLSKKWEVSANTFVNALTLYSNHDDSIQFFGANVRVGYVIQKPLSPWRFTLNAGWYYVTSFGSKIGIQNLNGPQVYPMVSYQVNKDQSVYGYFKYSPIADKFSLLKLSNREIAFGGGYGFKLFKQNFTAGVDVAMVSITFPQTQTGSTSISGLLGVRF